MHPEEEFNKALHINKVKGTHSISDAFLGTAQKQSMEYWNSIWFPFVSSCKFCTCSAIREKEKWIGESNGAVHLYGGVL